MWLTPPRRRENFSWDCSFVAPRAAPKYKRSLYAATDALKSIKKQLYKNLVKKLVNEQWKIISHTYLRMLCLQDLKADEHVGGTQLNHMQK